MWATLALSTVLNLTPAQKNNLDFENVRATYGVLGHERKDSKIYPGDIYVLTFDIVGLYSTTSAVGSAADGLKPHELAELIFAVSRGMLMRDVLQPQTMTAAERRARQLEVTRRLWRLLFTGQAQPTYA